MRVALIISCLLTGAAQCAPIEEKSILFAETKFRIVRASPAQVQIVWKNEHGRPYRTFDRVQAALAKQRKSVRFLMNAGIFETGGVPCGLHIEDKKTLHPLNLADAPGNFFLKPNGVVSIESVGTRRHAFVDTTESFVRRTKTQASEPLRIVYAAQSGPMLLINGRRHPAFKEGSASKLHRNGVGVDSSGQLVFAITDRGETVNLWDFAGLFLKLDCKNALFLDGDISQWIVDPKGPVQSNQFGAIFVIAEDME